MANQTHLHDLFHTHKKTHLDDPISFHGIIVIYGPYAADLTGLVLLQMILSNQNKWPQRSTQHMGDDIFSSL